MKTMKKLFLLLSSVLLVTALLLTVLVGCGGKKPNPEPDPTPTPTPTPDPDPAPERINFATDGNSIYSDAGLEPYADNLLVRIGTYAGVDLPTSDSEGEATILLLSMDDRDVSDVGVVGKYSISVEDGRLVVRVTDVKAAQLAVSRLYKMMGKSGFHVDPAFTESKTFDNYKSRTSVLVELTEAEIAKMTLLDKILVNNSPVGEYDPHTTEYEVAYPSLEGYPTLSARAASPNATVHILQPADNGGTGLISVTNSGETLVYTVAITLDSVYMDAAVINKDNTKGTITFVIDDGDQTTASYVVNTLFPKYGNVKATFAIITNRLVTLGKNADGTEWQKDENGNYVYTTKNDAVSFWRDVVATGRADLTSHSHTHAYWGDDDEGGSYEYTLNDGTTATSQSFPRGNVTMELLASQQILRDLFGVDSSVFIKPGVGAVLSQYYFDLLESSGYYIGARNTSHSPNAPIKMVNFAEDFATAKNRFNIKAYMIEHYNTSADLPTDASSSVDDCLDAGISYWTDYIDTAIAEGGWATFCIHLIKPDGYTGGGHFIYESQADALFAHADSYGSDVWMATLEEATKYYFLRSTTTVTAELVDELKISVALSDSEKSAAYSDVVLTVRVDVPSYWTGASVGGTEYEILEDESGKYIIMNIARGGYVTVDGTADITGDDADFEYTPVTGGLSAALPSAGRLTLGASTPLYYDPDDMTSAGIAHELAARLTDLSGKAVVATPDTSISEGAHVRILPVGKGGVVENRLRTLAGSVGAYRIYMQGGDLYLTATTDAALAAGCEALIASLSTGTSTITASGEPCFVDADGGAIDRATLAASTTLAGISVGGSEIDGFDPLITDYVIDVDTLEGYPRVEYLAYFGGSSVSMSPATEHSGGVCRIAVTSEDGGVGVYTVTLRDNSTPTSAEILHKGGADGVVTFVFDDGDHATATYIVNEAMPKYETLTVTLGLITNRIADLVYDEEGDCWLTDIHGNYIYVPRQSEVNFWREIIRSGRVELVSHSHTHAYWGEDDGGGVFEYLDNTGAQLTSEDFPKGNVTKELVASQQILRELFGAQSYSYILPGLRVRALSDFYYNLVYYGGYYIAARSGFSITGVNSVQRANRPEDMASYAIRYKVPALTTQYFRSNHNNVLTQGLPASTYLENGIDAWEQYIDNAIEQNGWACFLLHTVVADNAVPNEYAIFKSQADALFAYADAYGDRLWIATYDDAQIYYNQWSSASVSAVSSGERVRVDLTHRESGEMYGMPMTVRVEIPSDWTDASVNGTPLEIERDETSAYVLVDVTPGVPLIVEHTAPVTDTNDDADFELVPVD